MLISSSFRPNFTTLSAKGQSDVLSGCAHLDLASSRRDTSGPGDSRAGGVSAGLDELAASKGVAEDIAEVIPDLVVIEAVGEDGLGLAGVEAVLGLGDLEGLASRDGVLDEGLRVGSRLGRQGVHAGDVAAHGPEVDGVGAFVHNAGVSDGRYGWNHGGDDREDAEDVGEHFDDCVVEVEDSWVKVIMATLCQSS